MQGEGAGRTRWHLLGGGKLAKIVKKNSREILDCKFHMFASEIKTNSYSQRDRRLYCVFDCVRFDFQKPKTIGRQIWPPHQAAKGPATPLLTLMLSRWGWSPANIAINDISRKTKFFGLHFRRRRYWSAVADLRGGRAGSAPPPFGRRTDAVTVLLISENGSVLWRPIVS